jgi:rfaE bifunctional protein kinase chain/domain
VTATATLLDAAKRMQGVRVLVLADVIADRYHFGLPTRISREAPVMVLEQSGDATIPGGGANAANNARALGGGVELAGIVGDDPEADLLIAQLRTLGIATDGLVVEPGRATTTKTRIFAGPKGRGQQVVRIDRAERERPKAATRNALLRRCQELLPQVDAVLVSDYGYGAVDPAIAHALIEDARRRKVPVVADTQADPAAYRGASALTPNLAELEAWTGERLVTTQEVQRAADAIRKRLDVGAVVCTRGGEGISVVGPRRTWHLPVARQVEVFDVTGAGDTVAAALTLGLGARLDLVTASTLADCAASVVVRKLGAATCAPAELRAAIRGMDLAVADAAGIG